MKASKTASSPKTQPKDKRLKRQHKPENRLEPKKATINGIKYWRVWVGPRLGAAKASQKYFRSEEEAKTFIRQQLTALQNEGTAAFSISDEQRVAAVRAFEKLAEVGATLDEAVAYFLKHARPAGGVVDFTKAAESFQTSRKAKNCKPRYLVNLKSQCKLLGETFGERKVNELKKKDLETWLVSRAEAEEWNPKTRNNYIITLRALWSHCVDEKWCVENIASPIDKAILDDIPSTVFTPEQARKLLATASQCWDGAFLPAVAISLFAGLRRSEVCALDWKELRKDNKIEVAAGKAKTRHWRFVDIQPNLAEWLAPYRKESGPVFDGNEDAFNEKRKHLATEAELTWGRNVLRHSAASYHLAHFGDENQTALQMGHSPQVLIDHYRTLVTKEDAAEFWDIRPGNTDLETPICKRRKADATKKDDSK